VSATPVAPTAPSLSTARRDTPLVVVESAVVVSKLDDSSNITEIPFTS
jgi:hypothetical protein